VTEDILYHPIGIIHSPFKELAGMPVQPTGEASAPGSVEIYAQYAAGLKDLEGFSHLILIYHFHLVIQYKLSVTPFLGSEPHGIFATRAPARPNPIGISVVRLASIQGDTLFIDNLDILDGTPLLDVKPYVPGFDEGEDARIGWLEGVIENLKKTRSDDRFK
jgi:tRNA (adenine37-N6)-methyltransferase